MFNFQIMLSTKAKKEVMETHRGEPIMLSVATLEMNQQIRIIWMIPNPLLHLSFNHFRRTTSLHFLDAKSSLFIFFFFFFNLYLC
ncbi:hypothetical protein AQUCO_01200069v1 [Aquilegia coerulea]|uniref:Uncharacterized protein n=1 Tax=Aquilegia coerulea TaxID=218851 RepID=A0A2G5E4W7_AQUCA|nr:hypothetical protein AQUCO_01200069v1 [Aquilegia coerulea]PIA50608.1 hypothetical protein AQUCO_01200069v1 [Aquilegia coerulea]